ncbi:hypothetical protein ACVW00_002194 [Marmoricola sp. URHA0025 HA25]
MDVDSTFTSTRLSLHGVAELLLAGPQHAASGKITLRAVPGGFATTHAPDVRVDGTAVVSGGRRAPIEGHTAREIGKELGLPAGDLSEVYSDGSGVTLDDVLRADSSAAARIARVYELGDQALRALAPDSTAILWPEHFDIGISLDAERLNFGVSPGDSTLPAPYMYVGPWEPQPADAFWNQSFGAARELPDDVDSVVSFFDEARSRLGR